MFFSFAYLALRALLGLLIRSRRGPGVKDIELMILRHELGILRRQIRRVVNLLWSRFWPRRGFRPTFLRLYRSIP